MAVLVFKIGRKRASANEGKGQWEREVEYSSIFKQGNEEGRREGRVEYGSISKQQGPKEGIEE